LDELQAFHARFDREKGFDVDMLRNAAYLAEEVGEVVQAIRALNRAEDVPATDTARQHLGEELADCLAYVLKLANYAGVDMEKAYLRKMEVNLGRAWTGTTGPT
jgi:NTP pyrophosphatase (non-canonical NTP hydrolase)